MGLYAATKNRVGNTIDIFAQVKPPHSNGRGFPWQVSRGDIAQRVKKKLKQNTRNNVEKENRRRAEKERI